VGTIFNRPSWDVIHEVAARDRSVSVRSMLARLRGEDVALAILTPPSRLPADLDLSAAVDSSVPLVRAMVACLRDHISDAALERLRVDPDPDVAAAAQPDRRCGTFVSGSDARAHVTMFDLDAPARERLEAARSIVGARNPSADPIGYGAEAIHAACVVDTVVEVIRQADPGDAALVALADEVIRAEFDASIHQHGGHNVNEFGTGAIWREWITTLLLPAGNHLGTPLGGWEQLGNLLAACDAFDR